MSEKKFGGRGALLEKLRKHQEERPGAGEEELPPKCRGRAAYLQKLQQMKERKAGGLAEATPSDSTAPSEVTASSSRGAIAKVTKKVEQLEIVTPSETRVSFAGEQGTPLRATSNYICLDVEKDRGVFEYEVRFNPDIDARNNRIRLVNEALGELKTTKVYDGDVCLYLPSLAFGDHREFQSCIPNTETPVTTSITYKRKKRMGECLHLYNVLFKRIMTILLYNRIGRNYFNHDHKQIVPQHKLEVLPGFAVSVDEMEGGLMICLDTQHRVIRSQTVYELFQDIRSTSPRSFKEEVNKNVIGACVLTKYNNKSYIVDDITWDMTPKDSFDTRDGGTMSFVDYYKHHYNITIRDVDQPLLINRQTRKTNDGTVEHMICLIPELSFLTGLTDTMRNDFKVMKDVAAFTRVTPNQRALALKTYLQRVRQSEQATKVLAGWGLRISDSTVEIKARVLKAESILFGGKAPPVQVGGGGDWNKAIGDHQVTGPVDIHTWQLYYTKSNQKNAANFADKLVRAAKGMGCVIKPPQHVVLDDDRSECYRRMMQEKLHADVQVAVFVCPTMRADRYAIIKKICCINHPVASQVILNKTLNDTPKLRTIILKIGLQITCKLGGTLWSVAIPVSDWMVCGIDVYHGTNKQSVCGFVASINNNFTKYHNEVMFQQGEIGDFFKTAFRKSLIVRKNAMGSFPKKVVILRDGVGDGQLEHCRRYEVQQFLDVIEELKLDTTITFVVVQKRISTRIYRVDNSGNCENPPSGTIVDSTVTRRALADFYLVPQSVRQGTVNPTHYIVIHNDAGIIPDHVQRLAYKLCHLYYNWSGTIRVPAPCLYAHKLASLIGQVVQKVPGPELSDRLYYL